MHKLITKLGIHQKFGGKMSFGWERKCKNSETSETESIIKKRFKKKGQKERSDVTVLSTLVKLC